MRAYIVGGGDGGAEDDFDLGPLHSDGALSRRRMQATGRNSAPWAWTDLLWPLKMLPRKLSELKKRSSDAMDRAFSKHAMLVYDHAWKFIVISTLVTGIMALGIVFRRHENDMYKLYSFSGAPSNLVKTNLLKHFSPVRTTYIVAFSSEGHITKESLQGLSDIDQKVRNLTLDRDAVTLDEFGDPLERQKGFNPQNFPAKLKFQDLCSRDSWGDCNVISVLDLYTSPRVWGRPIVSREWPVVVNMRTKKAYRADAMLGNMTVVEKPQGDDFVYIIKNATAFGIRYDFLGENGWQHYSAALEKEIENVVSSSSIPGMQLSLKTERSISDELGRSSALGRWEMLLLTIAVFVVLGYTVLVNTTLSYRTKSLPGLMGVASTLMGYAGGAGFIYFCGLHHTPPAEATPFLVLGIGVDNAFVLINSYSLTFLIPDPRERIRHTTRDAGLSITCTTMTSVTALIIGAASPYESIAMFCVITAFCLFWGYVMALTFFLGWLVLDCRREVAHVKSQARAAGCLVTDGVASGAVPGGQRDDGAGPEAGRANPLAVEISASCRSGAVLQAGVGATGSPSHELCVAAERATATAEAAGHSSGGARQELARETGADATSTLDPSSGSPPGDALVRPHIVEDGSPTETEQKHTSPRPSCAPSEVSFKDNAADQAALLEQFGRMSTFGLVSLMVFRMDHKRALKQRKRLLAKKRKRDLVAASQPVLTRTPSLVGRKTRKLLHFLQRLSWHTRKPATAASEDLLTLERLNKVEPSPVTHDKTTPDSSPHG